MDSALAEGSGALALLERVRWVIIKSVGVVVVCAGVCFAFVGDIAELLELPLIWAARVGGSGAAPLVLRTLRPAEAFVVSIKIAVISGIVVACPVIFYQLWRLISSRISHRGHVMGFIVVGSGVGLFLAGLAFCFFVVLKLCVGFFWNYNAYMQISAEWTLSSYVSFVSMLLLAFGIAFEMPLAAAVLARVGLVTSRTLLAKISYAIVGIFLFAAVITPPDILSQLMLAVPMLVLYGISILVAAIMERDGESA